MKLDTTHLRYLTPEDWRVLTAVRPFPFFYGAISVVPGPNQLQITQVEIGSKNHEVIPTSLIIQISNLRSGSGAHKSISTLAKANLIARVKNAKYDGYRLTYGGLDYLALHTHFQRRTLHSTGPCIGTGKESDIHIVLAPPPSSSSSTSPANQKNAPIKAHKHPSPAAPPQRTSPAAKDNHQQVILKIHRLGRISFRTVKTNRDYLRHRHSATWMYMSRLSAMKEHTFMTALHGIGFPVPTPIAWNRHTVVMSLINGTPLYQIRHLSAHEARELYAELMAMIVRLADVGLIHGDFNEFNIMIEEHESPTKPLKQQTEITDENPQQEEVENDSTTTTTLHPILIDFPQMLSISHPNAPTYFARDVNCIKNYFSRRFHFASDDPGPFFSDVEKRLKKNKGGRRLDVEVEASGFSKKMAKELERYMEDVGVDGGGGDDGSGACEAGEDQVESDEGSGESSSEGFDPEGRFGHRDVTS
ncbi:MAG: hypothetical protein Q9181_001007 [Wetmoreana brouardii]